MIKEWFRTPKQTKPAGIQGLGWLQFSRGLGRIHKWLSNHKLHEWAVKSFAFLS